MKSEKQTIGGGYKTGKKAIVSVLKLKCVAYNIYIRFQSPNSLNFVHFKNTYCILMLTIVTANGLPDGCVNSFVLLLENCYFAPIQGA